MATLADRSRYAPFSRKICWKEWQTVCISLPSNYRIHCKDLELESTSGSSRAKRMNLDINAVQVESSGQHDTFRLHQITIQRLLPVRLRWALIQSISPQSALAETIAVGRFARFEWWKLSFSPGGEAWDSLCGCAQDGGQSCCDRRCRCTGAALGNMEKEWQGC